MGDVVSGWWSIIQNKGNAHFQSFLFVLLVVIRVASGALLRFTRKEDGSSFTFAPMSIRAVCEATKFVATFFMVDSPTVLLDSGMIQQSAYLAALYGFNLYLSYYVLLGVDPATVLMTKNATIVATAVIQRFRGIHFSTIQWIAVILQVTGLAIIHYDPETKSSLLSAYHYGAIFLNIVLSAFGSVWHGEILQKPQVDWARFSLSLYFFGTWIALTFFLLERDVAVFFEGWDWPVLFLLGGDLFAGIVISRIYSFKGGVMSKTFSMALSSVLLYGICIYFGWGVYDMILLICGGIVVAASTHLFTLGQ